MVSDLVFFLIILVLMPLLILAIGSILFYLYEFLTNAIITNTREQPLFKRFTDIRERLFFKQDDKLILNILIVIYLLTALFLAFIIIDYFNLTFIIMNFYNFPIFKVNLDLIIILFCLIMPLLFTGINYTNEQLSLSSKNFFNIIINYYLPIIFSILSIIILLWNYEINLKLLNIEDIMSFQNTSYIKFNELRFPAYFIIINPFAAVAFFTGMIGIFRTYRSESFVNNELNQKSFSKILRNTSFFVLILIFVLLFLGGGNIFDQNIQLNTLVSLFIILIIIIIIILIDYDRPKLFIERKLGGLTIPLIFSILSIIYSIFLTNFDFLVLI